MSEDETHADAAIADRLEAFASLLDLSGASYYTTRAYKVHPASSPRRP